jgi:hypothetical protein
LRLDTIRGSDVLAAGRRCPTQLGAVATTATIRERMGHGSLEVTSGYVHRVSEADRAAARHMAELFDQAQE